MKFMRITYLIFAAMLVQPTAALAEKVLDIEPKRGGVEAKGPGKQKPKKIPVGGKTAPRPFKPDMTRIVPLRIEFVAADHPRKVLTELRFEQRFFVRLVFLRLPGD